MQERDLTVGLSIRTEHWDETRDCLADIETWGYATRWLPSGAVPSLDRIGEVVRATRSLRVGTAVLPVGTFAWQDVARAYADVTSDHPGRVVVGLGVHGPRPLATLGDYLDHLDDAEHHAAGTDEVVLTVLPGAGTTLAESWRALSPAVVGQR